MHFEWDFCKDGTWSLLEVGSLFLSEFIFSNSDGLKQNGTSLMKHPVALPLFPPPCTHGPV